MVTVAPGCADEWGVTILGFDGDVSVEDQTAECLTAIARTYEEGLAHLAFLARLWEAPAVRSVPALPTMTPLPVEADEPAVPAEPVTPAVAAEPMAPVLLAEEPAMLPMAPVLLAEEPAMLPMAPVLLAEEPAMLPMAPVAVAAPAEVAVEAPVEAPVDVPVTVSPEALTAVELPVVLVSAAAIVEPATELIDTPEQDDEQVHVLFAEAATAEIPVQAAA
ncbi:MAG: hypothetical protein JWR62_2665 [Modestobacter sp.]|nr:hypothetical protein [Modestobacter sp.]